jgi:hypothetical protein
MLAIRNGGICSPAALARDLFLDALLVAEENFRIYALSRGFLIVALNASDKIRSTPFVM